MYLLNTSFADIFFMNLSSLIEQALHTQYQISQQTKEQLPGVTATVSLPDGSIISHACGFANKESHIRMTCNARMPAGSIGKTFVAAVVLSMVADGVVELDTPISKWFVDADWFCRLPNYNVITLRHLLNHSSGIIDHVYDTGTDSDNPAQAIDPHKLLQFALDRKPLFLPGTGFHYSDTGYILIGIIIEKASSHSYYYELSKRILIPLQLTDTVPLHRRDIPGIVQGYARQSRRLFGIPKRVIADNQLVLHPSIEWTGGGIVSTSSDLVRWAKALFEGKAITPHLLNQMLTSIAKPEQPPNTLGPVLGYGLGINIIKTEFGSCYRHHGFFPGYNSLLAYYPDKKIAIAMQINTDNAKIERNFNAIATEVFRPL